MRHLLALVAGILVFLVAVRSSRAGEVRIAATDGTPWSKVIERIQDNPSLAGRTFAIVVDDGDDAVECEEYKLALDPAAATAFRVGACDPATWATSLELVDRAALFEPGDIVPRARTVSVSATVSRRGSAQGGGAPAPAGSKMWCSVALQPYLFDRLRGQPVPLMPDRFVLRPIETHIQAAPDGSGWIARGESRFALRFHYTVTDIHTGKLVLENEASLVCSDAPVGTGARPGESLIDQVRRAVRETGDYVPRPSAESLTAEPLAPAPPPAPEPPAWVVSLDILSQATLVASVLLRPLGDVVLAGGTRASSLYDSRPAVAAYGGSTLGFTHQRGILFLPARFTLAGDAHTRALSAFAGLGVAANLGADTTIYAAPTLRYTSLRYGDLGDFDRVDGAALAGIRERLWNAISPECHGGLELFAEAAAPLGGKGTWFVSGGLTQSWGPGGGYYFSGCPSKKKGRR